MAALIMKLLIHEHILAHPIECPIRELRLP